MFSCCPLVCACVRRCEAPARHSRPACRRLLVCFFFINLLSTCCLSECLCIAIARTNLSNFIEFSVQVPVLGPPWQEYLLF